MELRTIFWFFVLIICSNLNGLELKEEPINFRSNYIPKIRSRILKLLQNEDQMLKSGFAQEDNGGTTPKLVVVSRSYELTTKITGATLARLATSTSTTESSNTIESSNAESTTQTPSTQRVKRTTTIPTEPDDKSNEEVTLNNSVNNTTNSEIGSQKAEIIEEISDVDANKLELEKVQSVPNTDQHDYINDERIAKVTNSTERNQKIPQKKIVYKVSIKLISASTTNMDPYMPFWYCKSDTYAIIYKCAPGKKGKIMDQSEVINNNNNPKWNWTTKTFEAVDADSIRIELWDKDIIWSDFIGSVEVNLASKKLVNKRITMKHGLGTITFVINKYKV